MDSLDSLGDATNPMDVLALSSKLMKGYVRKPEMKKKRVAVSRVFRAWTKAGLYNTQHERLRTVS